MQIKLEFTDIKPLPLNMIYSTNFKTGRRFKSQKYVIYESKINRKLRDFKAQINKFNKYFDESLHYITANYNFYYPILTKKDKRIGKTSTDISNMIKPVEDIIFKHFIADDSSIVSVCASKVHSENLRMEISYTIKQLNQIS